MRKRKIPSWDKEYEEKEERQRHEKIGEIVENVLGLKIVDFKSFTTYLEALKPLAVYGDNLHGYYKVMKYALEKENDEKKDIKRFYRRNWHEAEENIEKMAYWKIAETKKFLKKKGYTDEGTISEGIKFEEKMDELCYDLLDK